MNENRENMPVDNDDYLRGQPLNRKEKFFLGALMVVTGLWTVLLVEGVEWVVEWIRGW